jgi:hypothetical protein
MIFDMIPRSARFYFANLGADILRSSVAASDPVRYESSMLRVWRTLELLRDTGRPEAYEEGLLLTRALEYARESNELDSFKNKLNRIMETLAFLPDDEGGVTVESSLNKFAT